MTAVSANERNGEDSLEGEGAAVQLLGSAKTSLLGRGAAEQQELVGGVHEFQLLSKWYVRDEWERERDKQTENEYEPSNYIT